MSNKFDVLSIHYKKDGVNHAGKAQHSVSFKKVGEADSFAEARKVFGMKHPILQAKTPELYASLTKEMEII